MYLPMSITFAVAATVINLWLSIRVGKLRVSEKVLHGDGGVPMVSKRMRAHSNFGEYTPYVLILFALVEMTLGSQSWLWIFAAAYLLGRILHPLGMDADFPSKLRIVGIALTFFVTIALCVTGIYAVYSKGPEKLSTHTLEPLPSPAR